VRAASTTTTSTTLGLVDHPSLKIAMPASMTGSTYIFSFDVLFQSATITTGLKLGLTFPAAEVVSARVDIPVAADGTGADFTGWITSSGDSVVGTAVQAATTTYLARMEGTIRTSAPGTLQVQYAAEVSTAVGVIIVRESVGVMIPVA
jgi:hypothetical protein